MNNEIILLNPTQPNSGLFAFIWQTIRGIYHNQNERYYFYFGNECCYYDLNYNVGVSKINNVWDYYFKQPHSELYPVNIKKRIGLVFEFESEFREGVEFGLNYDEYNRRRFIFNDIISKYYILNSGIDSKINEYYTSNFLNRNVIGIHLRGTDHPNNTDILKYISQIKNIVGDNYIFATSDEQSKIDILSDVFGDKLLTYPTFRSKNGMPLHISLGHLHNPRLIGEEVLIESYLLAKTSLLLFYTGSNVNFYVRALNPHLPYIQLV